MKRLLVIAPSSYPVTGAEAIVNIKLLKALSKDEGFCIDLISKKDKWYNYPTDSINNMGLNLHSLNIVESDNTINLKSIWDHIKSFFIFGVTFKGANWAVIALPLIIKLVRSNKYDYVLTKNGASFLLGCYLKKHFGLKWIATWNDPFPSVKYPYPYGKGKDARGNLFDIITLKIIRKYADKHIFPNKRLRDYSLSYLKVPIEKTIIIPHVVIDVLYPSHLKDDRLKLIHSGNLRHPRNPQTLIAAMSVFHNKYPEAKIKLSIMGVLDDLTEKMIRTMNLESIIETIRPVSYQKSLDVLCDYDVAVIVEANCSEGIFLPTKVSDFMQCDKPIFSISPQIGCLNDLYINGRIPYFADVERVDSIEKSLEIIYSDWMSDNGVKNNNIPRDFSEKSIVEKYKNL